MFPSKCVPNLSGCSRLLTSTRSLRFVYINLILILILAPPIKRKSSAP